MGKTLTVFDELFTEGTYCSRFTHGVEFREQLGALFWLKIAHSTCMEGGLSTGCTNKAHYAWNRQKTPEIYILNMNGAHYVNQPVWIGLSMATHRDKLILASAVGPTINFARWQLWMRSPRDLGSGEVNKSPTDFENHGTAAGSSHTCTQSLICPIFDQSKILIHRYP